MGSVLQNVKSKKLKIPLPLFLAVVCLCLGYITTARQPYMLVDIKAATMVYLSRVSEAILISMIVTHR